MRFTSCCAVYMYALLCSAFLLLPADLQRQQIEGLRKADYQALAAAKRSGQLATIHFTLDLPDELADVEVTDRCVGVVWVLQHG